MLSQLADLENIWGPFRLFRYLTLRGLMAWLTALGVGFWVAPYLIKKLKSFKIMQAMRDESQVRELANLHASKKNTPTMGGLIIYISVMVSSLLWARMNVFVGVALLVYTVLTAIGFADDYLKITKKNTDGLPGRWKLIFQALLTCTALLLLMYFPSSMHSVREFWIPFLKDPLINEMPYWFMFILLFVVLGGASNGINLTDGVDGLAIGCTIIVALTYAVFAYITGHYYISKYLFVSYISGVEELMIVSIALVGAGLAFLWHNSYPATVFMGDTGSLALGGLIGVIAFMVHQPITLAIVGGIFVMEGMSVMLQVFSFKTRKKRIFRMAPIHHHFEIGGWHESKVVIRFWILCLIFALIGLSTLKLR